MIFLSFCAGIRGHLSIKMAPFLKWEKVSLHFLNFVVFRLKIPYQNNHIYKVTWLSAIESCEIGSSNLKEIIC